MGTSINYVIDFGRKEDGCSKKFDRILHTEEKPVQLFVKNGGGGSK